MSIVSNKRRKAKRKVAREAKPIDSTPDRVVETDTKYGVISPEPL